MSAKMKTDHHQLVEEIQVLRNQLEETEETLDAIRHGEIDALVVNGPDGEQVFTLEGADHPYRLMVETMREGAVTVTLDGTIVYCNQSFAELLGNGLERVTGTSMSLYIANEDISRFAELMEAGKRNSSKGELRLKTAIGAHVPVSISTSALHAHQLPAVCFVVTDLTEHKHNEELIASEKLAKALHEQSESLLAREQEARSQAEQANRIKDEFLATVSHELRNPLNAILGWSHILQTHEMDKGAQTQGLEVIERNARNQLKLIEDLLDVSRIVSGKLAFNFGEIDIVKVLEATVEAAQPAASAKRVHLVCNAGNGRRIVLGDAGRLQQIVGNLLSNAIKFTPSGGSVTVQLDLQPEHALITVKDTGEGIEEEFLPFVFERFRQADGSTKRVQGGLGLGLAIVRHLVELHRGSVTAESLGIGRGATFTVTLPLSTIQNPTTASRVHSSADSMRGGSEQKSSHILHGIKVLVLDDDGDAREFVQILLTGSGAQVRVVATASEGYSEVFEDAPDILICDIGLPNEDGYEFIRKIRSITESPAASIPALALTAYAHPNDRMKALAAGYHDHLTKPVAPNELLAAVARIGRRR